MNKERRRRRSHRESRKTLMDLAHFNGRTWLWALKDRLPALRRHSLDDCKPRSDIFSVSLSERGLTHNMEHEVSRFEQFMHVKRKKLHGICETETSECSAEISPPFIETGSSRRWERMMRGESRGRWMAGRNRRKGGIVWNMSERDRDRERDRKIHRIKYEKKKKVKRE